MACSHLFGRQAFQRMAFFLLGESNHASNANQVRLHFPTYVIFIHCKYTCTLLYLLMCVLHGLTVTGCLVCCCSTGEHVDGGDAALELTAVT